jgi:hypothetical protein
MQYANSKIVVSPLSPSTQPTGVLCFFNPYMIWPFLLSFSTGKISELLLLYFSTSLNMDLVICKFTLIFHISDSLKEGGMIFCQIIII